MQVLGLVPENFPGKRHCSFRIKFWKRFWASALGRASDGVEPKVVCFQERVPKQTVVCFELWVLL